MSIDVDTDAPTEAAGRKPRTYGNWRRPVSSGLFGRSRAFNVVAALTAIGGILIYFLSNNWKAALVWALLGAVGCIALGVPAPHNRTLGQNGLVWMRYWRARSTGTNLYRSGPLSGRDTCRLPGALSKVETTEYRDTLGRVFALGYYPSGHYFVAFEAQPDGAGGIDQDEIDLAVARYAAWLSEHPAIEGLIGASVITETAPDTGSRLEQAIDYREVDSAPPFAKAVMASCAQEYPEGSASLRCYITMTFEGGKRSPRKAMTQKARQEHVARSLAKELPMLTQSLIGSGAGPIVPMDKQTLAEVVRTAYDPEMGPVFEDARAKGSAQYAQGWPDCGPMAYDARWDYMIHDSGVSHTAAMSAPPRGPVREGLFGRLVEADDTVLRKRVALVFRIIPTEKAADVVETAHTDAVFNASAASKRTSVHNKDVAAAKKAADEEADGAGLVSFAVVATTTVRSLDDLELAKAAVRIPGSSARIKMRPAYNAQDSAFALTIPVGFQPHLHAKAPESMRKASK